jgi:hypothetical protein
LGEASCSFDPWLVDQIVECRRVLKWTYAYGFYLPENEHAKRAFFEYLQGQGASYSSNSLMIICHMPKLL